MLKNILGRIMALWAIVVFVLSLIVVVAFIAPTVNWPEPRRSRYLQPIYQRWLTFFFIVTGVRRVYKGKEHFNKSEAFVIVCNHRSLMDPPLSSPGIPEPNKTIAKVEMAKIPLFSVLYKSGSVLVDRKSAVSRQQSYVKMKEVLQMGIHMCIYPEGTRNKTKEPLRPFHDGAFKLAIESGKRMMPSVLFNTEKVLPNNKTFFFWPTKVEMHFLPPVTTANKSVQELKDEVYNLMKDYYQQHKTA